MPAATSPSTSPLPQSAGTRAQRARQIEAFNSSCTQLFLIPNSVVYHPGAGLEADLGALMPHGKRKLCETFYAKYPELKRHPLSERPVSPEHPGTAVDAKPNCPNGAECPFIHADLRSVTPMIVHRNLMYTSVDICKYRRLVESAAEAILAEVEPGLDVPKDAPDDLRAQAVDEILDAARINVLAPNGRPPYSTYNLNALLDTDGSKILLSFLADPRTTSLRKAISARYAQLAEFRGLHPEGVDSAADAPRPPPPEVVQIKLEERFTPEGEEPIPPPPIDVAERGDPEAPYSHCAHFYFNRLCYRGALCHFIHCIHVDSALAAEDDGITVAPAPPSVNSFPASRASRGSIASDHQGHHSNNSSHNSNHRSSNRSTPAAPTIQYVPIQCIPPGYAYGMYPVNAVPQGFVAYPQQYAVPAGIAPPVGMAGYGIPQQLPTMFVPQHHQQQMMMVPQQMAAVPMQMQMMAPAPMYAPQHQSAMHQQQPQQHMMPTLSQSDELLNSPSEGWSQFPNTQQSASDMFAVDEGSFQPTQYQQQQHRQQNAPPQQHAPPQQQQQSSSSVLGNWECTSGGYTTSTTNPGNNGNVYSNNGNVYGSQGPPMGLLNTYGQHQSYPPTSAASINSTPPASVSSWMGSSAMPANSNGQQQQQYRPRPIQNASPDQFQVTQSGNWGSTDFSLVNPLAPYSPVQQGVHSNHSTPKVQSGGGGFRTNVQQTPVSQQVGRLNSNNTNNNNHRGSLSTTSIPGSSISSANQIPVVGRFTQSNSTTPTGLSISVGHQPFHPQEGSHVGGGLFNSAPPLFSNFQGYQQ